MRVIEKSVVNQLISEAKAKLEKQKGSYYGEKMNVINAIDWLKIELDTLRKELEERTIDVKGGRDEKVVILDDSDFRSLSDD